MGNFLPLLANGYAPERERCFRGSSVVAGKSRRATTNSNSLPIDVSSSGAARATRRTGSPRRSSTLVPTRDRELELLAELHASAPESRAILAGVDEVGRGSLAGPVSVGIALIDATITSEAPEGLRDSKMLSAQARERLVPLCREWALDIAVGHAGPDVVDAEGIIGALRRAAAKALEQLRSRGLEPHGILLDGSHNWWTDVSIFDTDPLLPDLPVYMQVKADATCSVVAAASVVAKVERDRLMVELDSDFPGYDWARNKGYSSPAHIAALRKLGPTIAHRRSWHLPGVNEGDDR
ncbi:ribonuclease HII [Arcanobacterium haemolyticum]|nr:ribonuclease HII [Arcanobacterium haemolyticum]